MRFMCLWQWLGKGFHALQGVDVKWCPRAGHGLFLWGQPWTGHAVAAAWALCWGLPLVPPGPALWPSSLEPFLEGHSGHTCLTLAVTPAWHCALLARFLYWELGP